MNRIWLPLALVFLQFSLNALGLFSWSLFDGPLALAVMFAFFHSLDTRDTILYAVLCGLCRDLFTMDVFGLSSLSYVAIALSVSLATRFINRQNGYFVFPVVFIAAWICPYLAIGLKTFFADTVVTPVSGSFLARSFIQAVGTTALCVLLSFISRSCAWELTES